MARGRGKAQIWATSANLGFEAQLWDAANALRGSMDAAEYKHVVLGLIFLKYISDAFEEHREKLLAEPYADPEDPDEYRAENIFWVPPEARWSELQKNARQPTIGELVDRAMEAVERNNPSLKGVLPKDYARPALDKTRLGQLIDLISNLHLGGSENHARDILGRVYEYFLGQFASAEGKKGGEFYTPRCIVKLLVEMLRPYRGRIYDTCCGSGGMSVQSEEFIKAHGGRIGNISIYGQELNYTTWRLCKMNLAIRGIDGRIEHGDSFLNDRFPDLKADYRLDEAPSRAKRLVQEGDTVLSTIRPGRRSMFFVRQADPEWVVSTGFAVLRPRKERIDPRYLYACVYDRAFTQFLVRREKGAAYPAVLPEDIADAIIKLPPLPEQRAISHILGTLDDKIELNRRMSETLEAMARALFKSWFVDFDPVRAKMEGRWRRGGGANHDSPLQPGLPAHLYDLFPDRLVNSDVGEIPKGWRVVELGQVIEINSPRVLRKGQCAPYLDMASMPTRGHVPLRVVERHYTSGTRFTNGDTLLARITPCLENGKTAFVDFLAPNEVGWGSTEFIVLRPKPPLPAEFGYCLARDPDFREFAIQSMTGTSGRQRVQPEALAQYLLVIPSDDVAKAFGALVEPWFRKASASEHESRTLAALRDALLPKLIRGEIRVKDAERFLKERRL